MATLKQIQDLFNKRLNDAKTKVKNKKQSKKNKAPIYAQMKLPSKLGNYGGQLKSVVKRGLGETLRMIPSTANFGRVYMNPFETYGARLPVLPIYATKMLRTTCSGSGILNQDGFGWIACSPAQGIGHDYPVVRYSNNSASPPHIEYTGSIGSAAAKGPYTIPTFDANTENSLAFRIVAAGVRVRNVGTTLNSAGTVVMGQTNPRFDLTGYSIDDIKTIEGYKEGKFSDRSWHAVTRHVTTREDLDYQQNWNGVGGQFRTTPGGVTTNENNMYMGIMITGTPLQPFEWEFVGHYEVMGPNLEQRSLVPSDTTGVENIVSHASFMRHRDNYTPDHLAPKNGGATAPSGLTSFLKSAFQKAQPIAQAVGKIAGTLLPLSLIHI